MFSHPLFLYHLYPLSKNTAKLQFSANRSEPVSQEHGTSKNLTQWLDKERWP